MTTTNTTQDATLDRDELLLKAGMMAQRMTQALSAEKKPLIRDQRSKLRFYKNAFLGNEAVAWAVETGFAPSRVAATKLFDDFLTVGALLALSRKGHIFQDETYLYSWPVAGESGAPVIIDGRNSVSEEEGEAAVGDMAKLLHLHTAVAAKNQSRQDEWKKTQLPQIRKKIEQLETELGTWRKKLESAVENTKRNKNPSVESLIIIDDLEIAVASVTAELDNQKQLMHFPEPEGWVYRLGSEGVYVGIKHPYLEKIEAKWSLRAGSALTANSAFKDSGSGHHFEMRFSPVAVSVAFDGVSIVGEKGSGVPSFQTTHLALDMELLIEAQLKFNPATSTWKAPYFNFNLVDLGKTDVLGLPPAMLQWVINKFAPARVKTAILSALPVALGKYFAGGADIFEMSGSLAVRGIPFTVLESELQMSKPPTPSVSPADLPEVHWSALKLLNTGVDCITHGHVLALLRRRLSLQALGRNPLFKNCSKWSSVSQLLAYVRTLDRETSSMEYSEIMRTWQHALNTITAEDGLSPIDLQVMFDRLRLLDKVPFEVRYVISEFSGSIEASRLVDFLKDMGNEFLNAAKTDLTDVKVLNEMRKVRTFHEIDVWHKDTTKLLTQATNSLQKVSVALSGKLLGGKNGIFDVGTDSILVRLKPGAKFHINEYVMSPSDLSMSLFAVEDDGGKFIVDVGVPKSEKITEELKETEYDALLSLCTGEFWKKQNIRGEAEEAAEVYEGCKHFPTHDRVVMLTVGPSKMSLRADVASLIKNLQAMQKDDEGLADVLTVGFKPTLDNASATHDAFPKTTSVAPSTSSPVPRTSISEFLNDVSPVQSASSTTASIAPRTSTSLSAPATSASLSDLSDVLPSTAPRTSISLSTTSAPSTSSNLSTSADLSSTAAQSTSISLFTATTQTSASQIASSTSILGSTSAPTTPIVTTPQTTISSASVALPPLDLPPVKHASAPPSPTNATTIHLSAPVPPVSAVGLSATATALTEGLSSTTSSSPTKATVDVDSTDITPVKRNSISGANAEASNLSNKSTSAVKRNSLGNGSPPTSSAASKDASLLGSSSKLPSYTLGLDCVPDLFAELKIRDFRLMGAPRRISRFIHSTIRQTIQGKNGEDVDKKEAVDPVVDIEVKQPNALTSTSLSENIDKKNESKENSSELDPIHVALRHFVRDIGSESMLCRFTQSLDVTVQDNKLFVTLSRSSNKQIDSRPFVFCNTYIAADLYEKVMRVHSAIERVRAQS